MNVVYWPNIALAKPELLAALGAVDGVRLRVVASVDELVAQLPDTDGVVMANPSDAQADAIAAAMRAPNRVRWIHLVSAGMDGISRCGLPAHVVVTHTPGATANAVGDHALALLLALMRRLHVALELQRAGRWSQREAVRGVTSIEGATVVVLGHGGIGRYLCRVLDACGARLRVVSRRLPEGAGPAGAFTFEHLGEALDGADALIVAVPLSELTAGLVDEAALRRMRAGALVVNVGRGPVIEREGLLRCLADGHLGGAGLDVTDPEPLPEGDPTWTAPNLIVTPHYGGGGSRNGPRRIAERAVEVVESRRADVGGAAAR